MVQLKFLSGSRAGANWVARRFPVRIGRRSTSDLALEENGVWDEHLVISLEPSREFRLTTCPPALTRVNGQEVQDTLLRNGDTIEIGLLKLQFALIETRQVGLRLREWLVWLGIAGVSLGQVALVYWLLR